jgi:hypothetical protein
MKLTLTKANKLSVVNQAAKAPFLDPNFSEIKPVQTLGPQLPRLTTPPEAIQLAIPVEKVIVNPQQVITWEPMRTFDEGLRTALIDWIDTTKEGEKAPFSKSGRAKKMTFNFFGTATKMLKPGEIGEFTVVFSYPPGANIAGQPIPTERRL